MGDEPGPRAAAMCKLLDKGPQYMRAFETRVRDQRGITVHGHVISPDEIAAAIGYWRERRGPAQPAPAPGGVGEGPHLSPPIGHHPVVAGQGDRGVLEEVGALRAGIPLNLGNAVKGNGRQQSDAVVGDRNVGARILAASE